MTKEKTKGKKIDKKIKVEKLIVGFQSKFSKEGETLGLTVTLSKPLQTLLKKASVSGTREFVFPMGKDEKGNKKEKILKRTRVKSVIYNGFEGEGRDILFTEGLVINGKFTFDFYNVAELEKTIRRIKEGLSRAIKLINEYSNINKKIEFRLVD